MTYTVERREVTTIKNYRGRPGYGKEVRWYVLCDGKPVERDTCGYIQPGGIWFVRKRDALMEASAMQCRFYREGK